MSIVDKIIYNLLISRKAVSIPEVGVLKIESQPARKKSDGTMMPPRSELQCTPLGGKQSSAVELIGEIAATGGVGAAQAQQIFDEWLQSAKTPENIRIEGVGVVSAGEITIDPTLDAKLNPAEPEKSAGFNWKWLWVLLLVFVAILVWWVYANWSEVKPRIMAYFEPCSATEQPAEQPAEESGPSLAELEPIGAQSAEGAQNGYHVIVGVFDVEANADRMIARMADEGYTSTYKFIPGRARFYVTAGRFADEQDAICLKRQIDEVVPDVWVYPYRVAK
jgi:hypothetical protein